MPRIYTSANDPLDFCKKCFPLENIAEDRYGHIGEGPDNRGNCFSYNSEHPPYDVDDVGYYRCAKCRKMLIDEDN